MMEKILMNKSMDFYCILIDLINVARLPDKAVVKMSVIHSQKGP